MPNETGRDFEAAEPSELERLSGSLDRMTRRLVTRDRQLAEANDQLEARVAVSTAELAEANGS